MKRKHNGGVQEARTGGTTPLGTGRDRARKSRPSGGGGGGGLGNGGGRM